MTLVARPERKIHIRRKALIWLLGILLAFWILCLPRYLHIKQSANWPSVSGTITDSTMLSLRCKGVPCYRGQIEYRYRVGDVPYHCAALHLGRSRPAARDSWQRVLDQYPAGKEVRVYYEPQHPDNAILEPGLVGESILLYKMVVAMIWFFSVCFVAALLWYRDPQPSVKELQTNPRKSL